MNAEQCRKYIHEMVDKIVDYNGLMRIYMIVHFIFIKDRSRQIER